jgi:uncharacterized membrane protein YeaQ/YmgE (transglycosylase-associated protein family)
VFQILWMILIGFIVGLVARWLVPGVDAMGFWMTTGLGIVGSIVGGLISRIFTKPTQGTLIRPAGFLMSVIGAIIVMYIAKMMR